MLHHYLRVQRFQRYQIIVVLKGIVQGGDPLAVSVYQHISLLPKTRRLKKDTTYKNFGSVDYTYQ